MPSSVIACHAQTEASCPSVTITAQLGMCQIACSRDVVRMLMAA